MDKKQYYPAIFVRDFESGHAALAGLGIVDEEADFCLAGVVVDREQPVVFEIYLDDPDCILSEHPISKSAVVLMERPDGSVGLWFGMFNHLNDTREGALFDAVDDLLSNTPDGPPTLDVFEWAPPVRTLQ